MHEDPQIDLQDADEFFRRGDDGDYAEAESFPSTGIDLARGEAGGENEPTDPAVLEQRVERRARFTRWVKTGMSALTLATVAALAVRALSRSSDAELGQSSDGLERAARVEPARAASAVEALAQKVESARPEQEPPAAKPAPQLLAEAQSTAPPPAEAPGATRATLLFAEAQSTAAPTAEAQGTSPPQLIATSASQAPKIATAKIATAKVATAKVARAKSLRTTGQRVAVGVAVATPVGNSALPAVAIAKAPTESTQGAIRPPTARFAD